MQTLVTALSENPKFVELLDSIKKGDTPINVWGMDKRVIPMLVDSVPCENKQKLIVTYDERRARQIVEDFRFYDRNVFFYPAKDALFYYADIHSNATVKERLGIFKRIAEGENITVVTTIEGLMDKIPDLEQITNNVIVLSVNQELDIKEFSGKLTTLGYENPSGPLAVWHRCCYGV